MNIRKYFTYATLKTLTKTKYQEILNEFAKTHADATVERLNIHIRASLVNPIDEGIIPYDFTKGAVIKGESPSVNETDKYINYNEFKDLMALAKKIRSTICFSFYDSYSRIYWNAFCRAFRTNMGKCGLRERYD